MLNGIRNRIQGIKLIFYIVEKREIINIVDKKINILRKWKKLSEKGKEVFRDPRILKKRLAGDCDDLATLLAVIDKNKKIKLLLLIKNDAIYHIKTSYPKRY